MEQAKKLFLMSLTIVSLGTMVLQTSARRFSPALAKPVRAVLASVSAAALAGGASTFFAVPVPKARLSLAEQLRPLADATKLTLAGTLVDIEAFAAWLGKELNDIAYETNYSLDPYHKQKVVQEFDTMMNTDEAASSSGSSYQENWQLFLGWCGEVSTNLLDAVDQLLLLPNEEDVIQSVNGLLDAYSYNPYILLSSGELLTERVAPIAGIFPHLEEAIKAKLASLFLLTSSSDFTIIDDE